MWNFLEMKSLIRKISYDVTIVENQLNNNQFNWKKIALFIKLSKTGKNSWEFWAFMIFCLKKRGWIIFKKISKRFKWISQELIFFGELISGDFLLKKNISHP